MFRLDGQTATAHVSGRTLENPEPIDSLPLIQFEIQRDGRGCNAD
ncbi:MAG: hypothetical protein ACLSIL_16050 [Enterococcus casseliflavus]